MSESRVVPLHKPDEQLEAEKLAARRLVASIRDGDEAAERELIERYSRGLRFLLSRQLGDDERARDLLQETFIVALSKLRETPLEQPERLAGYLRGIAQNVARSGIRKRSREPLPMEPEAVDAIPTDDARPFARLSADQRAAAVRQLLESMTVERDRELLRRYYLYDEDKPTICRALGLDSLHFNRVLHRAKQRFRKIVEASALAGDSMADEKG